VEVQVADVPRGSGVRQVTTKFGGHPHWEFDTVLAEVDDVGAWLFMPAGSLMARPGRAVRTKVDSVTLVPHTAPYVATFHAVEDDPANQLRWRLYVDMTTPAQWEAPDLVTMLDLDLDVVQTVGGAVDTLDVDELAEHRLTYGYPDDLVALAEQSAVDVAAAVTAGTEPFGALGWTRLHEARRAYA
jgi:predicted RNA-binding protein associated with RNAse of E/G family